jgi:hypothetical protein
VTHWDTFLRGIAERVSQLSELREAPRSYEADVLFPASYLFREGQTTASAPAVAAEEEDPGGSMLGLCENAPVVSHMHYSRREVLREQQRVQQGEELNNIEVDSFVVYKYSIEGNPKVSPRSCICMTYTTTVHLV